MAHLGVTHWSTGLKADRLGISFASVARIWRKCGIQPHRVETVKFSTDPELEAKLRVISGTSGAGSAQPVTAVPAWICARLPAAGERLPACAATPHGLGSGRTPWGVSVPTAVTGRALDTRAIY